MIRVRKRRERGKLGFGFGIGGDRHRTKDIGGVGYATLHHDP